MRHLIAATVLFAGCSLAAGAAEDPKVAGACMTCHKEKTVGLYTQWFDSEHAAHNVTCLSCHQADRRDPDAFQHDDATIATLVTLADCGRCHPNEAKEVSESYHASAGQILNSAAPTCASCHMSATSTQKVTHDAAPTSVWPSAS